MLATHSGSCGSLLTRIRGFRELIVKMNDVTTRVANETGALLYDGTAELFDGHEANPYPNRANNETWIGEGSIHPTAEGYEEWGTAMALEGFA